MAYRSNPKDWIAYYNFYISIALLSLWEAMTAQSLSKMAYTKDNFLWNIEQKKNQEPGKWGSIKNLFKEFFNANANTQVEDTPGTRAMLKSLDELIYKYDPINNLTKTVNSTNIAGLLNDIQNIETNVTLLGIPIEDSDNKKKKEEMDKFLNGKELINENIILSCGQVGTFFLAMGKALKSFLEFEEQKSADDVSISAYFQQLIDVAKKDKDNQYKNITSSPPQIESNTFTGRSSAGVSLYFGWIMFFVIIIVSQFTEKGKSSIEVVVFFIICFGWLFQYTILNPALKKVISIELIDFPKILTFLIFCIINSVIAVAFVLMVRNEDDETRNGVYVLTTEGKKWRYGEWWEIIVSSIGSLTLGFLLFQLLPYFFTSTKVPGAESKQKSDS